MPSRAFLLFGRLLRDEQGRVVGAFQCPRGHFCFSDFKASAMFKEPNAGFNALAGIFAFRTGCSVTR